MKRPLLITLLIIVTVVGYGAYRFSTRSKGPQYDTVSAKRGIVVQEVQVTGKVTPAQSIELAFERAGKIAFVKVKVGDTVKAGQELVALETAELSAQLLEQQAALEAQQAKLAELVRGTRPEEITVSETKVSNARTALSDAELNLTNVKKKSDIDLNNLYDGVGDLLQDAYTKADDAVTKQTDELFTNDSSSDPNLSFTVFDGSTEQEAEARRSAATTILKNFKTQIDTLGTDEKTLDAALDNAEEHLIAVRVFLNAATNALNAALSLSQSNAVTYKANVNTGRTNVNTALSNISVKKQAIAAQRTTNQNNVQTADAKVNDAKNNLASAEAELALKKAGATAEELAAQRAQVKQALANVQNAHAQLSKVILVAPISGIVTKQNAKVGEIVATSVSLVAVISGNRFQIEANLPEADIAKVRVGQAASITLDAYGNELVFAAKIVTIDPAETVIDGVATYKVTLQFTKEDDRIKPGMTANVTVTTATRENVILIPQRSIIRKNDTIIVRVLAGRTIQELTVTVGLFGSDGNVEIMSGLAEGAMVVLASK